MVGFFAINLGVIFVVGFFGTAVSSVAGAFLGATFVDTGFRAGFLVLGAALLGAVDFFLATLVGWAVYFVAGSAAFLMPAVLAAWRDAGAC